MTIKRAACALIALLGLVGAAPAAPYGPAPKNAQSALVQRYVDALRGGRYADAFALLADDERKYFRDPKAFASVFTADGYVVRSAQIVGARGDANARVFFVREHIGYVDHRNDVKREMDATVPIGVHPEHGVLRIKDPGKPYRAFASNATADASDLRVTVKKVEFWPDRIDVVLTFANLGDNYVTVLPYGKTVLHDDKGNIYRIIAIKNWAMTDKQLFQGVPLAPQEQYTGQLTFTATRLDDPARTFTLDVAPALREGADAPFDVNVTIAPPAS